MRPVFRQKKIHVSVTFRPVNRSSGAWNKFTHMPYIPAFGLSFLITYYLFSYSFHVYIISRRPEHLAVDTWNPNKQTAQTPKPLAVYQSPFVGSPYIDHWRFPVQCRKTNKKFLPLTNHIKYRLEYAVRHHVMVKWLDWTVVENVMFAAVSQGRGASLMSPTKLMNLYDQKLSPL